MGETQQFYVITDDCYKVLNVYCSFRLKKFCIRKTYTKGRAFQTSQ